MATREKEARGDEFERRITEVTDWRQQFQQRPLAMVGLAFGGGLLLSSLIGGRSAITDLGRTRTLRTQGTADTSASEYQRQRARGTWENLKGTLIRLAAERARALMEELVPGFREQYSRTEAEKAALQGPAQRSPAA